MFAKHKFIINADDFDTFNQFNKAILDLIEKII